MAYGGLGASSSAINILKSVSRRSRGGKNEKPATKNSLYQKHPLGEIVEKMKE